VSCVSGRFGEDGSRGGRVLLFGIITAQEGALPFYDLYFKELSLISARVAKGEDYPSAIALVEQGTVRLEPRCERRHAARGAEGRIACWDRKAANG